MSSNHDKKVNQCWIIPAVDWLAGGCTHACVTTCGKTPHLSEHNFFSAISFPLKHMEAGLRSQSTFVYNVDREDPISINLDGGPRVYFPGDRITGKQLTRFAYFIRKKTKT